MDVIELIPGLHFLRFPVGHAYLCHDPDGLTLIDTSVPASAPQIATAIRALGHDPADLRRLILTHFHTDHAGSAAEIAAWGTAEVCAHHGDASFLRGEAPGPPPDLAGWERPLFDQVSRHVPAAPPAGRPRGRHRLFRPRRTHHQGRSSPAAGGRHAARRSQAVRCGRLGHQVGPEHRISQDDWFDEHDAVTSDAAESSMVDRLHLEFVL